MSVIVGTNVANSVYTYLTVSESDTTDPIFMDSGIGLLMTVQTFGGGGSGYDSGTITVQVSNDNTNWATLKDVHGTDGAFAAAGIFEMSTGAQYIRLSADSDIDDVDVIISFG